METIKALLGMLYFCSALIGWLYLLSCVLRGVMHCWMYLFYHDVRILIQDLKTFYQEDPELFHELTNYLGKETFPKCSLYAKEFNDAKKTIRIYGNLTTINQEKTSGLTRKSLKWLLSPENSIEEIPYQFIGREITFHRLTEGVRYLPVFGSIASNAEKQECSVIRELGIKNGGLYHDCCPTCGERILPEMLLSGISGVFHIQRIVVIENKLQQEAV